MARRFLPLANLRSAFAILLGVVAAAAARGDAGSAVITAAASYDVLATGFEDPSGMAVGRDGAVLITDRRAGTLTRITAAGVRQIILSSLHQPRGVAAGADGVYLLEGGTRVLRLDPNGIVSIASASLKQARAMAADPDGRIFIAARREHGEDEEILRLEASGTLTRIASGLIGVRALAADQTAIYVALDALVEERPERTTVARLPRRPDGAFGPAESLLRYTHHEPDGLAIDAAGDLFITGSLLEHGHPPSGVVLKRRNGGEAALVASGLSRPGPAAFGPQRDLFVLETRTPARVIRFRPPPPPVVDVSPFTNRTPLRVAGRAHADSLVQVTPLPAGGRVLAAGIADSTTGAYALTAPLAENADSRLSVTSTASRGDGLVSVPAIVSVTHDDHLPVVEILQPPAVTHVSSPFVFHARGADAGSGMHTLQLTVDHLTPAASSMASDGEPLEATAIIDTAALPEGLHSVTAEASDRAGNWAAAARLVVVDRTPPETFLLTGPAGETADRSGAFTFGGSDDQSPDLEFAWRLDEGPWSAFSSATEFQLADVAAGPHRFEVAARDRAGNVDRTPALQAFTVTALRVRIVQPVADSAIETETVWVRGTVDGGPDTTLRIPLPPVFQRSLSIEALPAPHEAGTFAAEVPVVPGMTSLTVIARDGAGAEAIETVPVRVVEPLLPSLRLEAFPPAGLAPHAVRFRAGGFPAGSVYTLDLVSDGIIEYSGNALPDREFVYATPGIHVATLRVLTADSEAFVAQGAIEVYDRARLEARLRSEWAGFRAAMRAGDAAAAASFVHSDRRAAWAEYFGRLTPAQFANTDAMFTDVTLLEVAPGRAECEMMRDENGLLYSFPVSFEIDVDGRWRLWQF